MHFYMKCWFKMKIKICLRSPKRRYWNTLLYKFNVWRRNTLALNWQKTTDLQKCQFFEDGRHLQVYVSRLLSNFFFQEACGVSIVCLLRSTNVSDVISAINKGVRAIVRDWLSKMSIGKYKGDNTEEIFGTIFPEENRAVNIDCCSVSMEIFLYVCIK